MADTEAERPDELARERKRDAGDVAAEEGPAALAAELDRLDDPPQTPAPKEAAPVTGGAPPGERPVLSNWNNEVLTDDKGEAVKDDEGEIVWHRAHVPVDAIAAKLFRIGGNWPKAVGHNNPKLFVDDGGQIKYLPDHELLFTWINRRATVAWGTRTDKRGHSLIPKGEFYQDVRLHAECFAAAESFPHEPKLQDRYYAWRAPADYPPKGQALAGLLQFFDNAETPEDALLIKALFVTTCWGSIQGKRPTFVICANKTGSGKSTLADTAGWLVGGCIDLELNRKGDEKIKTRMLSEGGLRKRILKIDNLKHIFSSELIEGLITARDISGDRHYEGEGDRPNDLLWIFTANTPSVGKDIAQRSWFVKLREIKYQSGWDEKVEAYIQNNRHKILADIVELLKSPAAALPEKTLDNERQAPFVAQVLARLTDDTSLILSALKQNHQRRNDADDDQDEALEIQSAIDELIYEPLDTIMPYEEYAEPRESGGGKGIRVAFKASKLYDKLNHKRNTDWSERTFGDKMKKHIAAGRLPRITWKRMDEGRFYLIEHKPEKLKDKLGYNALRKKEIEDYSSSLAAKVAGLAGETPP